MKFESKLNLGDKVRNPRGAIGTIKHITSLCTPRHKYCVFQQPQAVLPECASYSINTGGKSLSLLSTFLTSLAGLIFPQLGEKP
jgi:hypothetical protein